MSLPWDVGTGWSSQPWKFHGSLSLWLSVQQIRQRSCDETWGKVMPRNVLTGKSSCIDLCSYINFKVSCIAGFLNEPLSYSCINLKKGNKDSLLFGIFWLLQIHSRCISMFLRKMLKNIAAKRRWFVVCPFPLQRNENSKDLSFLSSTTQLKYIYFSYHSW